ncbi:choice-of-anchor D domain-containing protein [Micromonospora sp. NPDC050200]|uniref:choice-of-anchor D domain-containing protein n=1 Tax=Micromonospora sp. NPDC050200 TaxID=3155664 RepID=UPI0033EB4B07
MFRTLLGVSVALAGVVAGLPEVASAAPTAPFTAITADRGDHGYTPVPASDVWTPDNAVVSGYPSQGDALRLRAARGEQYVDVVLAPPTGSVWVAGQTYPAARFAGSGNARIDITTPGQGCNIVAASVAVADVARDPDTQLINSFAASYEYRCDGDPGTLSGELRWNSKVDYVAAVPSPGQVDLGSLEVGGAGATRTVSFASRGSVPEVFGAARLTGSAPGQFAVTGDTCSGRTVAPGAGCTVTVASRATLTGTHTANLALPDNSSHGRRVVPLTYRAAYGVTGMYYPLPPQRLMDTRSGLGAPKAKIGAGQTVDLVVEGRGGVPSVGVGSVVLNVTVTNPTTASFLNVYPAGEIRPDASSINFPAGWLGSNNVTVKVGAAGKVSIYNRNGATDVVVDVVGFYAGDHLDLAKVGVGGQYGALDPTRLFDSRLTGGAVQAGRAVQLWTDFGPELSGHVRGLVLNVTAVNPVRDGFLTVWSGEGALPTSSTVNYGAGKVVPNLTIVKTSSCTDCGTGHAVPSFGVHTAQTSNIVVDLVGVMDDGQVPDGLRFRPLRPTRIVDSRVGLGITGALGPNTTRSVSTYREEIPSDTAALVTNVTAVAPTNNTVITVWPAALLKPTSSNLNPAAGQTVSNAVLTGIVPGHQFNAHNLSGSTHLVTDVVGTFYRYPGTASGTGGTRFAVLGSGIRPTR